MALYYLKSRYYDPAVKRFINGDKLLCTTEQLGFNLYAYCYNNPVINIDPSGKCAYKANSYDFYRANHGLPAAECKLAKMRVQKMDTIMLKSIQIIIQNCPEMKHWNIPKK